MGRAAVPSGASTGAYEAHELRDKDERYHGKGVKKPISYIKSKISEVVIGQEVSEQSLIDKKMCELDGEDNKSNLGANSILGVSMACAKAAALENNLDVFEYLAFDKNNIKLPVPLMNILNGGAHANNGLDAVSYTHLTLPTKRIV